jgi:UPF0042 nucleotide-binding protein
MCCGIDRQGLPVAAHIRKDPAFDEAFTRIRELIEMLLPRYRAQGKAYVNVAFGCTGGRHRSVFVAEEITIGVAGGRLCPQPGPPQPGLARAADLVEGKH